MKYKKFQKDFCELFESIQFNGFSIIGYDLNKNLIIYIPSNKEYMKVNINDMFKHFDHKFKSKIKSKIYDDYCQKMLLFTYYPLKLNENYKHEKNNIAEKCNSNLNEEYKKLHEKYKRIVDILGKFDGLKFSQLPISVLD